MAGWLDGWMDGWVLICISLMNNCEQSLHLFMMDVYPLVKSLSIFSAQSFIEENMLFLLISNSLYILYADQEYMFQFLARLPIFFKLCFDIKNSSFTTVQFSPLFYHQCFLCLKFFLTQRSEILFICIF